MLAGYNLRQIPHHFGVQPQTDPLRCDMLRRFLFAHICRNSLFIICSLQNSSYCLLSTISGIFTINALLQQPCVPFHFDKQASFATSTPTNFCLQNHNSHLSKNCMTNIPFIPQFKINFISLSNKSLFKCLFISSPDPKAQIRH